MNFYFNVVDIETCDHDLRARLNTSNGEYRAVCNKCGFDAGQVNLSGWTVLYGTSADHNPIVAPKPTTGGEQWTMLTT